jgi:hypothetical protein
MFRRGAKAHMSSVFISVLGNEKTTKSEAGKATEREWRRQKSITLYFILFTFGKKSLI